MCKALRDWEAEIREEVNKEYQNREAEIRKEYIEKMEEDQTEIENLQKEILLLRAQLAKANG